MKMSDANDLFIPPARSEKSRFRDCRTTNVRSVIVGRVGGVRRVVARWNMRQISRTGPTLDMIEIPTLGQVLQDVETLGNQ